MTKYKKLEQEDFDQNLKRFGELEKRGTFYPMFLDMINKGFETEAFLFILSTWNFAVFRYAMKEFDLKNFQKTVNELRPCFNKFKDKSIETINFNDYKKEVTLLFDALSRIKGVQLTGASKLMHLAVPNVFVMWDGYIRKACGFKKGNSEDYFDFLKKMQQEFKNIKQRNGRTLAKCIDEYNYVKFTLPALEKNRNKRKIIEGKRR